MDTPLNKYNVYVGFCLKTWSSHYDYLDWLDGGGSKNMPEYKHKTRNSQLRLESIGPNDLVDLSKKPGIINIMK